MTPTLEILDDALADAEDAAGWYAERSEAAAAAFVDELEHAIAEIQRMPATWPRFAHGTRRVLLKRFLTASIARPINASWSSLSRTRIDGPGPKASAPGTNLRS